MDYVIQGKFEGSDEWETVTTETTRKDARRSLAVYRNNDPDNPYRMRNVVPGETVTTWADGFGVWHARVDFAGEYDSDDIGLHRSRLRRKAQRAIRRELEERDAIGKRVACRVQLVECKPTSIEYREVAD